MSGGQRVDIACQQVLVDDAAVFSVQWLILPACHGTKLRPEQLLEHYLAHVRRATLSLVRPGPCPDGIEFRVIGSRLSLLSFTGPVLTSSAHAATATLRICGGLLVQPRQRDGGELVFRTESIDNGIRVSLELSDYRPLLLGSRTPSIWRKLLYRLTQAYIHKAVTIRFLARIHRELEGTAGRVRVVRVTVRSGENT